LQRASLNDRWSNRWPQAADSDRVTRPRVSTGPTYWGAGGLEIFLTKRGDDLVLAGHRDATGSAFFDGADAEAIHSDALASRSGH
jgi:hypothetical protein